MRPRTVQPVALMLILLLTAARASARTPCSESLEDLRENARARFGPLYVTPSVQLKHLGVDTNVFNQAGEGQTDFMVNLSPGAEVRAQMTRRALFTVAAATDLVWYAKYTSERSFDPQVTARVDTCLHRLTLFAENAYVNTRQRPNMEIDLRARHLENTTSLGAAYRITPSLSVEVAGRRAITRFDADAFFLGSSLHDTLNHTTGGVSVTARHRVTPLTTVVLDIERSGDRFPYASSRNTDTLRIVPGIEFTPRALIKGSAHVGFRRFSPLQASVLPGYSGVTARSSLSYTLRGATMFGVSYDRDVSYSFEVSQPYYLSTRIGASVRRAIGGRFDVLVSADRILHTYRDFQPASPDSSAFPRREPRRIDITWNYAVSLGYRLGSMARVGVGASFWQRDSSTKTFRNYRSVLIGTTLTYGS